MKVIKKLAMSIAARRMHHPIRTLKRRSASGKTHSHFAKLNLELLHHQHLRRKSHRRLCREHNRLTGLLAADDEVEEAIQAPKEGNAQRDVRLLPTHAVHKERTDEIEDHAEQIRQQAENRDELVLDEPVH